MEVLFNVPPDLKRRLEYIPKSALPNILADVFRRGFEAIDRQALDEIKQDKQDTASVDMAAILEAIKNMQVQTSAIKQEEPAEVVQKPVEVSVVTAPMPMQDIADLGDLMSLLK